MIIAFGSIFLGALFLMIAGDLLVKGAVALSLKLHLSPTVIGLTVVAFGTSAPELMVSLQAALSGSADIALGNVIGSNIANILLIIGAPAFIALPILHSGMIKYNYAFMLIASIALFLIALLWGEINRFIAICFIISLLGFIIYNLYLHKKLDVKEDGASEEITKGDKIANWKMLLFIFIGIVGLPLGAKILVTGASDIALAFGISQAAIGLTIVALGTSLPELAASIAAAYRGHSEIAVANAIGSNLFNIFSILGFTALVTPLKIADDFLMLDLPLMILSVLIIGPFVLEKIKFTRFFALLLLLAYGIYVIMVLGV